MNWSVKQILPLALSCMLLSSHAYAKHGGKHGHDGDNKERIFKQLDLSKEQKEKLADMRGKDRDQFKKFMEKKRALHDQMRSAFESDTGDGDLKKIHKEMQTLRNDMEDLRFEKVLKIRSVLTPDQRKKFQALKEEHRKKHWGKGAKGKRGGPKAEPADDSKEE